MIILYYCIRNTLISQSEYNLKMFENRIEKWVELRNKTLNMFDEVIEKTIQNHYLIFIAVITVIMGVAGCAIGMLTLVSAPIAVPITFIVLGICNLALTAAAIVIIFIQKIRIKFTNEHYIQDQRKLDEALDFAWRAYYINEMIQERGKTDAKLADMILYMYF